MKAPRIIIRFNGHEIFSGDLVRLIEHLYDKPGCNLTIEGVDLALSVEQDGRGQCVYQRLEAPAPDD